MKASVSTLTEKAKGMLRRTSLYDQIFFIQQSLAFREWENRGRVDPPPHLLKQLTVKEYANRFSIRTFVETGTYLGHMILATRDTFCKIVSVEIDRAISESAKRKFARFKHISIINGDSGEVLLDILAKINKPCLFWLDAHYSRGITARGRIETPIMQELHHIVNHTIEDHIVLIDDARLFVGRNGYPSLEELRDLIRAARRDWLFEVRDDIVRIHKSQRLMETDSEKSFRSAGSARHQMLTRRRL